MLYVAAYSALRIFLAWLALSPRLYHASDVDRRWDLAEAIVEATDDPGEQSTLALIAYRESSLRSEVARCTVLGDRGRALGIFQIHPIEARDAAAACGDAHAQVGLALRYVRRSAEACPGNVGADRLAMYVSGTCARGLPQAARRWGGGPI